nr:hypothetical protein 11 [bacterium]
MFMSHGKVEEPEDQVIQKIKKLYSNYGIDISDMTEEEFFRIRAKYLQRPDGDLDRDLEESQKHIATFHDRII